MSNLKKQYTTDSDSAWGFSYDFSTAKPIDTRSVVTTFNALTIPATWKIGSQYMAYTGMMVACADTGKIYVYIGATGDATAIQEESNWIAQGATGGGDTPSFSGSASDVIYNNTSSGLSAENVQAAIDELEERRKSTYVVEHGTIESDGEGGIQLKVEDLSYHAGFVTDSRKENVYYLSMIGENHIQVYGTDYVYDFQRTGEEEKGDICQSYEAYPVNSDVFAKKSDIPTESTVEGWGFKKGAYIKPDGGIPSDDLSGGVQEFLSKADTALQPAALSDYAKSADVATDIEEAINSLTEDMEVGDDKKKTIANAIVKAKEEITAAYTQAIEVAITTSINGILNGSY